MLAYRTTVVSLPDVAYLTTSNIHYRQANYEHLPLHRVTIRNSRYNVYCNRQHEYIPDKPRN